MIQCAPSPWDLLSPDLQTNIFSRLVETIVCASVRSQKQRQRRMYLHMSLVCKRWLALIRQAVQTLTFTNPHSRLSGKGLWMFPNLSTINLLGLPLASLSDELAQAMSLHCPNLQRVNVSFPEGSVMDQDGWDALVSRLNCLTRFQVRCLVWRRTVSHIACMVAHNGSTGFGLKRRNCTLTSNLHSKRDW